MSLFKKRRNKTNTLRSGVKPPLYSCDRRGNSQVMYLDVTGYSDPEENPRLQKGVGLKYRDHK